MRVNELYIAHQGEGPDLGLEAVFVRLHLCPVHCAWCDTKFTWDGSEEGRSMPVPDLVQAALELAQPAKVHHVVVTGGEPLVHKELPSLLYALTDAGFSVEVETSAILPPPPGPPGFEHLWFNDSKVSWNLSPKLPSAQATIQPDPKVIAKWLQVHRFTARLKLVVADDVDWRAACTLLAALAAEGVETGERTWVMPCATTLEALADRQRWLLETVRGYGVRVTTRMHVLAYGDQRGR